MTFEEKLVEHLQQSGLAAFIEDKEALKDVARKVVAKAVLEPRKTGTGYYQADIPSIAVEAAKSIAEEACRAIVQEEVQKLKNDPAMIALMRSSMAEMWPVVVADQLKELLTGMRESILQEVTEKVASRLREGTL